MMPVSPIEQSILACRSRLRPATQIGGLVGAGSVRRLRSADGAASYRKVADSDPLEELAPSGDSLICQADH